MRLWLMWVLATAVAFCAGGRLGASLSPSTDIIVTGYIAITSSLLLAGVVQWLILRGAIPDAGRWMPASMCAVVIIGVVVYGIGLINRDVGWVLGVIVGWIALGVFQWMVLRGQVDGAGWWALAHTLGLALAIPVVGFVTWVTGAPADTPMGGFFRWLAFGAAYAVATGSALLWLLKERVEPALS